MKRIILSIISVLAFSLCQAQQGYKIEGKIAGDCNGMKVLIQNSAYPPKTINSTTIKDNKFLMSGQIAAPGLYRWIIDKTPQGEKSDEMNWLSGNFYLENADITFEGDIRTLPTYYWNESPQTDPIIKGSVSEDLYRAFRASISDLLKARSLANEEYLEKYHRPALEGVFNTAEGIRLARQISKIDRQIDEATIRFIKQNPASVVAFDQASYFMEDQVKLTAAQIGELVEVLKTAWENKPKMNILREKATKAQKIALGAPYQDIELTDPQGKKVKLSDYIPTGKYVMLEFWASWCGPCRGEIPHLKHIYQEYKDKGFEIVSVSIDQKNKDWQKAMKEEKMTWPQLNDSQGKNGPSIQVYGVRGVPYCILLDKEGKIIKTNMRGASLNAVLEQLIP